MVLDVRKNRHRLFPTGTTKEDELCRVQTFDLKHAENMLCSAENRCYANIERLGRDLAFNWQNMCIRLKKMKVVNWQIFDACRVRKFHS